MGAAALLAAGLAAGWAAYRLTARWAQRSAARHAEQAAHLQHLLDAAHNRAAATNPEQRPGTNPGALAECEAIWKETQS